MFEVAFSRRMCCSRVARVKTKPRLPLRSVVCPTNRPGICLTNCSRVAITPQYGPPNPRGTPNDCASKAMMSACCGGFTIPREMASAIATTNSAPCLWAISAMAATSSIVPKKFGDCMRTQAVSPVMDLSKSSGSNRPASVKDNVLIGRPWW